MNNKKIEYLVNCMLEYGSDSSCPYCHSKDVKVIDRKYFFARLMECNNCHLYFRHPKDNKDESRLFYQSDYEETDITRNIPDPDQLKEFKKTSFQNSGKDYNEKIETITSLLPSTPAIKIVDYGSSWGYASYQFKQRNFQVQSFEISIPTAKKGNELLDLDIKTTVSELLPGNNVFFSAHVIEHLPDLIDFFAIAKKLLLEDGLMITYCPNGSSEFRKKHPLAFHSIWGMVHPNYLNSEFFKYVFARNPYLITSAPYDLSFIQSWNRRDQVVGQLDGDEILAVAVVNKLI